MNVFVTGSSSRLARAVVPILCAEPGVARVTGVDLSAPCFVHPKFRAAQLDIRDTRLPALLDGHDALVHLAFVVLRGRMKEEDMFDVNVAGSQKVFYAARRAGIGRIVHMSSAAVYGCGSHLDESAPFAPLPGFLYAQHKAHLEQMLEAEFPDSVRLRPHLILGPNAQPLLRQLLSLPCYPIIPEPQPLLQCVHEDDVAQAVLLALACNVRGAFNLAVEDSFSYRDAIKRRHRFCIPLPLGMARAGLEFAWRFYGWGGEAAWIRGVAQSLQLNCGRAATEMGWISRHSAAEVLSAI